MKNENSASLVTDQILWVISVLYVILSTITCNPQGYWSSQIFIDFATTKALQRPFFVWSLCVIHCCIPLQHRSCSVCMSFVRLGHHNG